MPTLLNRKDLDAARCWRDHPPRIHDKKKRTIFELLGAGRTPTGMVSVTRWAPGDPDLAVGPLAAASRVRSSAGPMTYESPGPGTDVWHVNFADPELFAFYGGPAFAQDEIQVAEHPILASVREALLADAAFPARTREGGGPAPVLVYGAERWGAIDLRPALAQPHGIYGHRLGRATDDALRQAVARLDVPFRTNVIAMCAPQGRGPYSTEDVRDVLSSSVTAFAAAKVESARLAPGAGVRIHTGHWGTGVFGGDRVLMAAAQAIAARLTGVGELVYHSLDDAAAHAFEEGMRLADGLREGASFDAIVATFDACGFVWGAGDGN